MNKPFETTEKYLDGKFNAIQGHLSGFATVRLLIKCNNKTQSENVDLIESDYLKFIKDLMLIKEAIRMYKLKSFNFGLENIEMIHKIFTSIIDVEIEGNMSSYNILENNSHKDLVSSHHLFLMAAKNDFLTNFIYHDHNN